MNFVFDIGNVLIDFKPMVFLKEWLKDPQHQEKINEIVFKSGEWIELDRGTISAREACEAFCQRQPQYRELIIKTMQRIPEMLTPISETAALLAPIKAAGHGLYYLSNYHKDLSRYVQEKYRFFEHFDGGVFSCDIHTIKPEPEIYRYFLEKYKLAPDTCLFIDDTAANVAGAVKVGMQGVLFTRAEDLQKQWLGV